VKAYTTLFDDCMPELPGADAAMVLHAIKRVCNDFYERSLYSREILTPMNIVANQATYAAVSGDPTNFECGKIISVKMNTGSSAGPVKLEPRSTNQLDDELPNWSVQTGTPKYYTQTAIDNVVLAYVPDTSYTAGLLITISKLPLYAGGGIDDFVFEKFAEGLGAGVKSRMMRMPKKPWSNPNLAEEYGRYFDDEVSAAQAIASRSYGAGRLRTRAWG
jgi:hypothetical protein